MGPQSDRFSHITSQSNTFQLLPHKIIGIKFSFPNIVQVSSWISYSWIFLQPSFIPFSYYLLIIAVATLLVCHWGGGRYPGAKDKAWVSVLLTWGLAWWYAFIKFLEITYLNCTCLWQWSSLLQWPFHCRHCSPDG